MIRLYYPVSRLWPDYLRSAAGLSICLGLLLFAAPQSVIFVLLVGLSMLFAWLGAVTAWRQQFEIELDTSGVTALSRWGGGRRRVIRWSDVREIALRYYSTRRDRSEGWLQLMIKGRGRGLRVDSDLSGFPHLVQAALAAAERNGVPVSESTRMNAARIIGSGNGLETAS